MAKRGLASKVIVSTLDLFSDMPTYTDTDGVQICSVTEREAKTRLMSFGLFPISRWLFPTTTTTALSIT